MPLFFLPYLYMQIAVAGATSKWTNPVSPDLDE
jgi:hypothetical protein